MPITWDTSAQRYRAPSGKFVAEAALRHEVQLVSQGSADRMANLTRALVDGALDVPAWQQQMATEIKSAHLATASAAQGGWAQMAPADFGWAGQRIRTQYEYLRKFADDV